MSFSLDTQKLAEMVSLMDDTVAAFNDTHIEKINYLAIPHSAAPLFDAGFHASFSDLQTTTGEAAQAIVSALTEVASALHTIVDHYQTMEAQHGYDFDQALSAG